MLGLLTPVHVSARQMAYNIDVVKTNVPEALEILVDSVVNPKFVSWEVNAAINKMREDIKTVKDNPQTVLLEVCGSLNSCAEAQQPPAPQLANPHLWRGVHSNKMGCSAVTQ